MSLTTEVKSIIEEDVNKCIEQQKTSIGSKKLFQELIAKYSTIYDGFKDEIPMTGKCASKSGEFDYRPELNSIKAKLEMILATGILKKREISSINISNSNSNTININISFDEVKHQIENMSSLSDTETNEALRKIDEIKAIVELQEPKKSKWQKIRPILVWLADKSVDVGIALLPLILKI